MPELPDIELYLHALRERVQGKPMKDARLKSVFLLRTVDPSLDSMKGREVRGFRRIGKRIVFEMGELEGEPVFMVFHLMISGRFQWKKPGAKLGGPDLAAFDFAEGTLVMTEASKKKRAKLHIVRGEAALAEHDPGGIDPLTASVSSFGEALRAHNHTIKRALTDPRIFSGIGNAYSDEILFEAKLPPHKWTSRLTDDEVGRLHAAVAATLKEWTRRLIDELQGAWPKKVTAFRPDMKVHGKYGEPCVRCGEKIQRVAFASNEMNYCATCQNEGKLLADRGLSRLLKGDWPKTLEQLEEMKRERKA